MSIENPVPQMPENESEPTPEKNIDTWSELKKSPHESEENHLELKRLLEIPLSFYQDVFDKQSPEVQEAIEQEYHDLTWEVYSGPDREGVKRRFQDFFRRLDALKGEK